MALLPSYLHEFHRPVWAEIDLDCVAHNIRAFQRMLPPGTQIMAVVKADAYGHGAAEVAQAALQAGAARLGVAILEEGILLRQKGLTAPIQILGVSAPGTENAVVAYNLIPTICTLASARNFAAVGQALGKTIPFHAKLDTGMGRIGLRADKLLEFSNGLQALSNLEMEGVFSHFAKADETDQTYTAQQLRAYQHCLEVLQAQGWQPRIRCLANSAAAMATPAALFDMVRLGISLYGLYPSAEVNHARVALQPVLSWKTRIAHLKTVPAGEAISYGGMFVAPRPTVVATLPLGYADGLRRRLWQTGGQVIVKGCRAPLIGRICMDMCMVDVTDAPGVAVGDEVVLIGKQGHEAITAEEMAARLETINYEITCLVGKRVPRVYFQNGKVKAVYSLLGEVRFNS